MRNTGICIDFDEDCEGLKDHKACYKYAPLNGFCPFLHHKPDTTKCLSSSWMKPGEGPKQRLLCVFPETIAFDFYPINSGPLHEAFLKKFEKRKLIK